MRETVLEERDGAVVVLTMNRPRQRNAFNRQMWHELRDALRDAQEDPGVHAVVVTGTAGAFSAGQDLSEMTGADDPGRVRRRRADAAAWLDRPRANGFELSRHFGGCCGGKSCGKEIHLPNLQRLHDCAAQRACERLLPAG